MARTCRRGERGGGGLGDKQKRERDEWTASQFLLRIIKFMMMMKK